MHPFIKCVTIFQNASCYDLKVIARVGYTTVFSKLQNPKLCELVPMWSLECVRFEEEADFSSRLWRIAAVEPLVSQNTELVPRGSLTGD